MSGQNLKFYLEHPESKFRYIKLTKNGVEKYVYVNKEGLPIYDEIGTNKRYIYLNKNSGKLITGNGKSYAININGNPVKTSNGYLVENNNNISLPSKNFKKE